MKKKYAVEVLALNSIYNATVFEVENITQLFERAFQTNLCRMDVVELKPGECRTFRLMNAERFK